MTSYTQSRTEPPPTPRMLPEEGLVLAVIHRAVQDYANPAAGISPEDRQRARLFLFSDRVEGPEGLAWWADLLDLDAGGIRNKARALKKRLRECGNVLPSGYDEEYSTAQEADQPGHPGRHRRRRRLRPTR